MISLHKSELGRALTRLYMCDDLHESARVLAHFQSLPFKHSKLITTAFRQSRMAGRARRVSDPFFDRLSARLLADQAHALVSAHHARFTPAQEI